MIERFSFFAFPLIAAIVCMDYTTVSLKVHKQRLPTDLPSVATTAQVSSQEKAARLWEQAIAAKGGEERLYAVHNIVISSRGGYMTHMHRKARVRREELCVLPDKYWLWDDYRPDVFGLTVRMYDYASKTSYMATNGELNEPPALTKDSQGHKALVTHQLDFLLETRWLRPTIVKASSSRIGLRSVDIVQTLVEGERVDFALDRDSHLPIQISYFDVFQGKTYVREHKFSDYADVGGIKVPLKIEYADSGGSDKYKIDIQFNVQYDQSILRRPPAVTVGPEAWKAKKVK